MQQILLFYSKEGLIELPYLVGEDFFLYKCYGGFKNLWCDLPSQKVILMT